MSENFRIALCLHGLASGKNSKGRKVHADIGAKCWVKQLVENKWGYQVDVFLHSWSIDVKDKLIDWYQPKKCLIEEQINFITDFSVKDEMSKIRDAHCQRLKKEHKSKENEKGERKCYLCYKWMPKSRFNSDSTKITCDNCYYIMKLYYRNLHSLYYSYYQANRLKSAYEKEEGFTYDLVITGRFDLWVGDIIDLKELNPAKIYFLMFEKKNGFQKHMIDHIFISSSKQIDQFCEIYPKLKSYTGQLLKRKSVCQYMNHDVIKIHLERLGLMDQIEELLDKFPGGAMSTIKPERLKDFLKEKCQLLTDEDLKNL